MLTLTNPAIQMHKNKIPREGVCGVLTEATAESTEVTSALRSRTLLPRAPSFRFPCRVARRRNPNQPRPPHRPSGTVYEKSGSRNPKP